MEVMEVADILRIEDGKELLDAFESWKQKFCATKLGKKTFSVEKRGYLFNVFEDDMSYLTLYDALEQCEWESWKEVLIITGDCDEITVRSAGHNKYHVIKGNEIHEVFAGTYEDLAMSISILAEN